MPQTPRERVQNLQRFALWTQFFPLRQIYGLLYKIAILLCTRRLRRVPGVRCVYLRRGLAGSDPIYGLSDIDLLVLVDGVDCERSKARVKNTYTALRRLVPMLPEGELALYVPEQFRELYTHCPFYRNRFDVGRRRWRRLWGEDLFQHLPPVQDPRTYLAGFELSTCWRYLTEELVPGDERPLYLRRYIAYKMIADTASAALIAQGGDESEGRDAALQRAIETWPEIRTTLQRIREWRSDLLAPGDPAADEVLSAFRFLAHAAQSRQAAKALPSGNIRIMGLPADHVQRCLGEGALKAIEEACAALGGVEKAVLTPRLNFDPLATVGLEPAAFAGATVDAFDLLLAGRDFPSAGQVRQFNRRLRHLSSRLNSFFCDEGLALALQPVPSWAVRSCRLAPELFAYLSSAEGGGALTVAGPISVTRPFEGAGDLEQRARTLLSLFTKAEIFQMASCEFFVVFWESLRAACATLNPDSGIPVTSGQIVPTLAELGMPGGEVLTKLFEEYWKDLRGEPSVLARYRVWASKYAGNLLARIDPTSNSAEPLPEEALTELSVSVIIATRNRGDLLKRALESLARQRRVPDEVVVVDNASTDTTAEVALTFQGRLNLKVVREDMIGIPYARNAGLRTANGDVLAFIDDDCEAEPEWLAELEKPFLEDPHVGSVGGSVLPLEGLTGVVARFYGSRQTSDGEGSAAR